MSESVHVLRVPTLPDNQEAAITFHHNGSVTIYVLEEDVSPKGALALEGALSAGRTQYDRLWGHRLAIAV